MGFTTKGSKSHTQLQCYTQGHGIQHYKTDYNENNIWMYSVSKY